jgi:hypothetical protein
LLVTVRQRWYWRFQTEKSTEFVSKCRFSLFILILDLFDSVQKYFKLRQWGFICLGLSNEML